MATNSSGPTPHNTRRDNAIACSIMFFALALLSLMLGWADGVRHRHTILHIPETDAWLVTALVLAILGIVFLVWARSAKRTWRLDK
jgi:putative Mn2+ efflux pump MntP